MSTDALVDLVITGHDSDHKVADIVQKLMELLGTKTPQMEYKLSEALIFEGNSSSALEGVPQAVAEKYQAVFAKLKVHSEIRPSIQILIEKEDVELENKTHTCPSCEYEQPLAAEGEMNVCDRCGIIAEKFQRNERFRAAMEDERLKAMRHHEASVRSSVERSEQAEERALRSQAREALGLEKKKQKVSSTVIAGIAAMVIAAVGVTVYQYQEELSDFFYPTEPSIIAAEDMDPNEYSFYPDGDTFIALKKEHEKEMLHSIKNNNQRVIAPNSTLETLTKIANKQIAPVDVSGLGITKSHTNLDTSETQPSSSFQTPERTSAFKDDHINSAVSPSPTFVSNATPDQITQIQFQEDKQYVQRLLKDNKYELAHIFIETVNSPYQQAKLYSDILQHKIKKRQTITLQDETLQRLQQQAQPSSKQTPEQTALIAGVMSYSYQLLNDPNQAKTVLDRGVQLVEAFMTHEERVKIFLKMSDEQNQFAQPKVATRLLAIAEKHIQGTPIQVQDRYLAKVAMGYMSLNDTYNAQRVQQRIRHPETKQRLANLIPTS